MYISSEVFQKGPPYCMREYSIHIGILPIGISLFANSFYQFIDSRSFFPPRMPKIFLNRGKPVLSSNFRRFFPFLFS